MRGLRGRRWGCKTNVSRRAARLNVGVLTRQNERSVIRCEPGDHRYADRHIRKRWRPFGQRGSGGRQALSLDRGRRTTMAA